MQDAGCRMEKGYANLLPVATARGGQLAKLPLQLGHTCFCLLLSF